MPELDPASRSSVAASVRLRASWLRSEACQVPLDEVPPVFSGALDTGSLFAESGRAVLAGLRGALAGEPIGIVLADARGLVLERVLDDAAMARALDRVHLAPGFSYAETDAGTNGLGLALADRAPTLVRGDEHWVEALREYTCAAAPVLDPTTGEVAGTVNLTTWSRAESGLLLALATSAATSTTALMLARSGGAGAAGGGPLGARGTAPRGAVHRVVVGRAEAEPCTSASWRAAVARAADLVTAGAALAVVGEDGAGRTALVAAARRRAGLRGTLLAAPAPEPGGVAAWLSAWTPVLAEDGACVVVSGAAQLPAWAADELAARLLAARRAPGQPQPYALTCDDAGALAPALAAAVDAVVDVAPLRERPEDVVPLVEHFARAHRGRPVTTAPAAARALTAYPWPGGLDQLRAVAGAAAARTDVIDVRHLPPELLAGAGRALTRLEALERDEIVRALATPGTTVAQAAERLGISRATVYRRIGRYGIDVPRGGA